MEWTCKCTAINKPDSTECWHCGASIVQSQAELAARQQTVERRDAAASLADLQRQQLAAKLNSARADGTASLADILRAEVGNTIGINIKDPGKIAAAMLVEVQADYFTAEAGGVQYHIPFQAVLRVLTGGDSEAVSIGTFFTKEYSLVVTVLDMVIYKGFASVGWSMRLPIDS